MPWFKVDDNFAFHPKAITATNSALGLWVRAGSWCGANLTGGRLPAGMVGTLGGLKRDARTLVDVGLWIEVEDGYQFKDWELYQPTKEQVEAERAAARARQAAYRARHRNGVTVAVTDDVTNAVSDGAPSLPVPSRPSSSASRRKQSTSIPAGWEPTSKHREQAKTRGVDCDYQATRFRNWAEAKDQRYVSWDAAFRNWLDNANPGERPASVPQQTSSPWDRAPRIGGAA